MVTGEPSAGPRNGSDLELPCVHSQAGAACPTVTLETSEDGQLAFRTCSMRPYAVGISNAETLDYSYSNISSEAVGLLLPAFKNLKTFKYDNGGSIVGYEPFEPQEYVCALQKYQGHSLQYLRIGDEVEDDETACFESLRQFQALKIVKLASSLLPKPVGASPPSQEGSPTVNDNSIFVTPTSAGFGVSSNRDEGEIAISKLVDFLPASIAHFCLTMESSHTHLEPMFEGSVEQHAEALPNLRLHCLNYGKDGDIKLWEKMGRDAGVEVEFDNFDQFGCNEVLRYLELVSKTPK